MLNLAEFWLVTMMLGGFYVLFRIAQIIFARLKRVSMEKHFAGKVAQYKYNVIIRLFLEFYIELVLFSLVNIIQVITGDSNFYLTSFVLSVLFIVICMYLPRFIHKLFKKKQDELLRK